MSTDVSLEIDGIKPKTDKHDKMFKIYNDCREMNIKVPEEVLEYFEMDCVNDKEINENGVVVEYFSESWKHDNFEKRKKINGFEYFQNENLGHGDFGYIIDIDKLPKDIKFLKCSVHYG